MRKRNKLLVTPDDKRWSKFDDLASVGEIAKLYKRRPRTVRMWCDEGKVVAVQVGGHWLIDRTSVEDLFRVRRDKAG